MSGPKHTAKASTVHETPQMMVWKGNFGREYTDRNTLDAEDLDLLYRKNYGTTRSEINHSFLREVAKEASILEVGCNTGNQLLALQKLGWSNLAGVELQPYAIENARTRLPSMEIKEGSALELPWANASFDMVFTSGVLIHIAPQDLTLAMNEIHRTSRKYIWGLEYYAAEATGVTYREHDALLWKMDFARRYLELFDDLELVKEQRLPYLDSENVDTVFLLKKRQ
jgi:pseudaminic acid biosynthesis-associated methylase